MEGTVGSIGACVGKRVVVLALPGLWLQEDINNRKAVIPNNPGLLALRLGAFIFEVYPGKIRRKFKGEKTSFLCVY